MDIKETFLKLTSRTYPHGTEKDLDNLLPDFLDIDEFGNRFIKIGDSPTCMFTSHLDTATSTNADINHVFDGNIVKTDGTTILGADDKAGVTIMLYMIQNEIPGLYYFFLGEEVGCVGSRALSAKIKNNKIEGIQKVISFDRRGTDSVITFQSSSRCCSDKFGEALAKELNKNVSFNYKIDPTGIYTDSAQFTRIYPECTNISVGYRSEHTFAESQDLDHLEQLARTCLIVDWENLPVERDPSVYESRYSGYGYGGYWDSEWEEYYGWNSLSNDRRQSYGSSYTPGRVYKPEPPKDESFYFMDDEFDNYISSVKINSLTKKLIAVDFSNERLEEEKTTIIDFLDSLEVDYKEVKWDGYKLVVLHDVHQGGHKTEADREELAEFLHSLDFWRKEIESDYKGNHWSYEGEKIF
jgi:hypothetical protein